MYSVVLMVAAAAATDAPADHRRGHSHRAVYDRPAYYRPPVYYRPAVYYPPVVQAQAATHQEEEQQEEQEARVHPQSAQDMRMLEKVLEWIPDAAERKKVLGYWVAPGVDSRARKEFYLELKKEAGDDEEEEEVQAEAAPCAVVVHLPADATLTIDGEATTSTSPRRKFVSPALPPGRKFTYTLAATFDRDGESVTVEKVVRVSAGGEVEVTID
jgi:uncharacterized protein (TIGR03000 family)